MSIKYALAIALASQLGCLARTASGLQEDIDIPAADMLVNYKKTILVVSNKDGVAAIRFDKPISNGVAYRYRFLPNGQTQEQIGEGKVFERYKITLNLWIIQMVKNDGGELVVRAGPISLTWSLHDRASGYIYFDPTKTRIETSDADDFEKIDLRVRAMSK